MANRRPERNLRVAALPLDVVGGAAEQNVDAVREALERCVERGVDLLVLPELWPTSFPPSRAEGAALDAVLAEDAGAWRAVETLVRESGVWVVGTGLDRDPNGGDAAPARPVNRARLLAPDGTRAVYDKAHLFTPTAEHLAFCQGGERPSVVAGPAAHDGSPSALAMAVCYDLRFGAPLQQLPAAGVEVLVVPAQWPASRASHWRALVLGRAVELQCFVVGCNRSGVESVGRRGLALEFPGNALIASPDGEVLAEGDGSGALIVADLDLERVGRLRRDVPVGRDARCDLR
ncbi:2-oxoglutaramate amidase [Planctomycetes bacterium Pla163]|uniref:2-oxoglutaramate amidase n=1 Tax=Rohdeia mirabilis TaxID=2528008 RepID=A0A518CYB4_9BACT|nr:2-oxoglutaramate amidase [Planctomycetes bacterium Pla163]